MEFIKDRFLKVCIKARMVKIWIININIWYYMLIVLIIMKYECNMIFNWMVDDIKMYTFL